MKTNNKSGVFAALRMAARAHYPLTIGTLLCVASSVIASLRPPLPTFQYNLLQQKLMLLNCCVEELRNNSDEDSDEDSDDSPLFFSDSEDEEASFVHHPHGKGILNWSGWFLGGSDVPCWLPITRDKAILTVVEGAKNDP